MLDDQDWETETLPGGFIIAGRYRIERLLGGGAMGSVYLAVDMLLENIRVAVKVLHREYARDRKSARRFLREVQLMHLVNHPNVVRTYDIGADKNLIFFTMEYVSGIPLDGFKPQDFKDYDLLANVTLQICAGLEEIHNCRIVHRDLKPGNILVSQDNQIKIADFGVARPVSSKMTQHREIIGSLDYMAPEVWKGQELTPAVDFYALGVILYELTTGSLPFDADLPASVMWLHCNELPAEPKEVCAGIPEWLNRLIMDLLAKEPSQRPATAREIIERIQHRAFKDRSADEERMFPNFSAAEDAKKQDQDALQPSRSEDTSPEADKPKAGMRSATSGIIFRELPTADEIRAHEERVRERLQRKGRADLSATLPRIPNVEMPTEEAENKQAIRRIERMLSWIAVSSVVGIGGMAVVMYNSRANEQKLSEVTFRSMTAERAPLQQPSVIPDDPSSRTFSELNTVNAILSLLATVSSPQSQPSSSSHDAASGFAPSSYTSHTVVPTETQRAALQSASGNNPRATVSRAQVQSSAESSRFRNPLASSFEKGFGGPEPSNVERNETFRDATGIFSADELESEIRQASSEVNAAVQQAVRRVIPVQRIPAPQLTRVFHPRDLTQRFPLITRFFENFDSLVPKDFEQLRELKVSEEDIERALKIHSHSERLGKISLVLSSLNGKKIDPRELESERRSIAAALTAVARELDDELGQYLYWSTKAQELATPNLLIAIAGDLARLSSEVREQKERYESAETAYRKALEAGSDPAQARVEQLSEQRMILQDTVTRTIRYNVEQRLTNLVNLEYAQEILQREDSNIEQLLKLSQAPSRAASREELLTERKKVEAELKKLLEIMPQERATLLRRAKLLDNRVK